jgi:hypothetical protein
MGRGTNSPLNSGGRLPLSLTCALLLVNVSCGGRSKAPDHRTHLALGAVVFETRAFFLGPGQGLLINEGLATEMEVLKSPRIIRHAAERLALSDRSRALGLAHLLESAATIRRRGEALVLELGVEGNRVDEVQGVCGAVLETYIEDRLEQKQHAADWQVERLAKQVADLRSRDPKSPALAKLGEELEAADRLRTDLRNDVRLLEPCHLAR